MISRSSIPALLVVLLLAACGKPVGLGSGGEGAFFPHPEGYEDARHGPDAVADGAGCEGCHGVNPGDGVRGAPTTAPACRECHEAYPHRGRFHEGAAHGPQWLADSAADGAACGACHGTAGERIPAASDRGRCGSCHSTYPHAEGWEEAEAHGAAARIRGGDAACSTCHGVDGASVEAASCAGCHEFYPHASGWADPLAHGLAARRSPTEGDPGCGASCHVADEAAPERLLCASCHDLFPHAEDWAQAHPSVTQQRGEPACAACHDGGDAIGPRLPVSCGPSCHRGATP